MSFHVELSPEIQEINFPEEFVGDLKEMMPLISQSIERDGLPIDSGAFKIGKMDNRLSHAYFLLVWISEVNGVIENLNLVLNDLRKLPHNYCFLGGSPKARFYFLVRNYFYEFYRFREIHGQIVKAAAVRGYIERSEVPIARKLFHDAFQTTIELRNSLVHGSPTWTGKDHFDLNMVSMAWEQGYVLKDKQTGAIKEISDALRVVSDKTANNLKDEGVRMSHMLQELTRFYVNAFLETKDHTQTHLKR